MQKSDSQDNRAENQYNQTALDMSAMSSTNVESQNGSDALYDAAKVTQQTSVDSSKTIGEVDSIKEESLASNEGRSHADNIDNEMHDITPMTYSALEAVQTDKTGKGCMEIKTDAVSSSTPESLSGNFDLDIPKENKHIDSCSTCRGEDNQSFRVKIDPESTELLSVGTSSTEPSSQISVSDSIGIPHPAYKESPSSELIADDQMSSPLTSCQVDKLDQSTNIDFPLDEKLEKLSLDDIDRDILGGENIEDGDAFISALHNAEEGFQPSIGTDLEKSGKSEELESASDNLQPDALRDIVEDDLPPNLNSKSFDAERTTYNPSLWTPTEIDIATGNLECTFMEHSLPLKSTYTEVVVYVEIFWPHFSYRTNCHISCLSCFKRCNLLCCINIL